MDTTITTVVDKKELTLSRAMKDIIEEAISNLPEDRAFVENEILFQITEIFMNRFSGNRLEYQLKRMGMETTEPIKKAIRLYMTRYANTK